MSNDPGSLPCTVHNSRRTSQVWGLGDQDVFSIRQNSHFAKTGPFSIFCISVAKISGTVYFMILGT